LIYLISISWIACSTVSKSQLPWSPWPWWGIFYQILKEATRQQSIEIKIYGLLAIMVLLRVVSRDCWLVVVLAQNEHYHGRSDARLFRFCCLMLDRHVRKRFLNDLRGRYGKKELQRWIWRKIGRPYFFMNI
jgi:hypothetical protein